MQSLLHSPFDCAMLLLLLLLALAAVWLSGLADALALLCSILGRGRQESQPSSCTTDLLGVQGQDLLLLLLLFVAVGAPVTSAASGADSSSDAAALTTAAASAAA
jgi:hypothetical protein